MVKSISDKIFEVIRDDITWGKYRPGERLVENQFIECFQVSRSPVREALKKLESEGLVERNGRGVEVTCLSVKEVDELYSLRGLLESYATGLAAEKFEKQDISYLKDLHEKLKIAATNMDIVNWLTYNDLFHDYFCKRCGNANLIQLIDNIKRKVYRYRYITVNIPGHYTSYLWEHEQIMEGCKNNNGKIAEKYMKLHWKNTQMILAKHLNEINPNY